MSPDARKQLEEQATHLEQIAAANVGPYPNVYAQDAENIRAALAEVDRMRRERDAIAALLVGAASAKLAAVFGHVNNGAPEGVPNHHVTLAIPDGETIRGSGRDWAQAVRAAAGLTGEPIAKAAAEGEPR